MTRLTLSILEGLEVHSQKNIDTYSEKVGIALHALGASQPAAQSKAYVMLDPQA